MSIEEFENKLKGLTEKIPYQWRVQAYTPKENPKKATLVAYIDARDAMNLLDKVIGPSNWQSDYKMVGTNMYAGVGIWNGVQWIWKWDVGNNDAGIEQEKSEASDSFKRACVKWGVGRFLYDMDILHVKAQKGSFNNEIVDESGESVKPWDVNKYATKLYNSRHKEQTKEENTPAEKEEKAEKVEKKKTEKSKETEKEPEEKTEFSAEEKKVINDRVLNARKIINNQNIFSIQDAEKSRNAISKAIEDKNTPKLLTLLSRIEEYKKKWDEENKE